MNTPEYVCLWCMVIYNGLVSYPLQVLEPVGGRGADIRPNLGRGAHCSAQWENET